MFVISFQAYTFVKHQHLNGMRVNADLYLGDSKDILQSLPDNSVDLVFTSPPYADQRKGTYGGVHPDHYVEWFLPISAQLLRVLKPTGTFVLNIKEKVVEGERSTYVMELILAMRKQGWLWTEEFIWHKKNSYPGKWPNRFRDSWERLLQFNKEKKFVMYQDTVMVPMGDWAKSRLKNLSSTDKRRNNSKVGSGFGKNISNWLDRDMAYPTNVLHLATECGNKTTAPPSRKNCRSGSSNCLRRKAIPYLIRLWAPEQQTWSLNGCAAIQLASRLFRNIMTAYGNKYIRHNYIYLSLKQIMKSLNLKNVQQYVEDNIAPFHQKRI